jgi:hypothetical protein
MTPLAAKVLKYNKRELAAGLTLGIIERMHDTYVFDCTPLAEHDWWELFCAPPKIANMQQGPSMFQAAVECTSLDQILVPAKKTWIEYICPTSGLLTALHTTKIPDADEFTASLFVERPKGVHHYYGIGRLCFEIGDRSNGAIGEWVQRTPSLKNMQDQYGLGTDGDLGAWVTCLSVINSSRSQHVPTTVPRKQRRAAQSEMKRHNITFLGCSQVHLKQAEDPRLQQPVMTAEQASKCRHKVRAHNRNLSSGKTITIREHWRGDARNGVKDSTYIVSRDAA